MISLEVIGIRLVSPDDPPVLLLQERGGTRCLPIWIGTQEAAAIAAALESEPPERPLTHDLLAAVLSIVSSDGGEVQITEIHDGIYEASLHLSEFAIQARPSDCVAVALRLDWPIRCPRSLLDQAGVEVSEGARDEVEAFRAFLDSVNPDDFEDEES